ncbi:protein FAM200C-like [Palaemon carinicauda]|uniref:protein FAM200C-like n=1 Tax=Palaemon carinicauda TaxID=392227 RepID=UPI0035B6406A
MTNSLKIKRERFDRSGTLSKLGFVPVEKPLLQASYEVAVLCAKKKKAHTIAEELLKPCALKMAKTVLGTEAEKKLKQIPLSNDIIHSRIPDMSQDVLQQVITDLKASPVKVRWLSRGRVLTRVFELHEEIMQFLRNQGSEIADHFENREFILSLAYLADVFMHLNELNVSMQGTAMNMITAREKLSALTKKLPMWIKRIESGNFANFPSLDEAASAEEELPILSEVKEHLQERIQSFQGYFHLEEGSVAQRWIRDPFLFNLDSMDDNDIMKDDLVELQTNDRIRMEFEKIQLDMFWCAQLQAFPQLSRRALEVLVPFTTTYLCEAGFLTLLHIKTKVRNRLDASDDMRLALSMKEPRLNNIINEKQQQKSH